MMMRKQQLVWLTVLLLVSCHSLLVTPASAAEAGPAKVAKSLQAWQQAKQKCSGNYSYSVRWQSFVGFGHETTVVVKSNKVVERRYREFKRRPPVPVPNKPNVKPNPAGPLWVEKGKELGSHKKDAAAKTLDQLYKEAAEVAKRKLPANERRYVRVDKQGLLLACFTIDTRIADDAPHQGSQHYQYPTRQSEIRPPVLPPRNYSLGGDQRGIPRSLSCFSYRTSWGCFAA